MKSTLLFLLFAVLSTYYVSGQEQEQKVHLILDTDIGMGFDDVGAIAMLHALADSNYVEIRGMVSSNKYELSVQCMDVLNTFYGRPDIPLGITRNKYAVNISTRLPIKWPEELVKNYPHRIRSTNDVPDAIDTYRSILAQADDHSITICSIGFLTNLQDLLLSEADEYSPLTGIELVSLKIKSLVIMGGSFPHGREFNFLKDATAARTVLNEWPTEVIISGSEIGSEVITGQGIAQLQVLDNPVKDVYDLCVNQSDHYTGMSWDQTAVLVAVMGAEPFYNLEKGICSVDSVGSNTWVKSEKGGHYRLIPKMAPTEVAKIIDKYMKHLPVR